MNNFGAIGWVDLTCENAAAVMDFYQKVAGWKASEVRVEDYDDFVMQKSDTGEPVAGICHQRGANRDIPNQWLIYIQVEDLAASIDACEKSGGKVLSPPRNLGSYGRMCIIEDPAGAIAALLQP